MTNERRPSPWPYFFITGLLALVPVLNNQYPAAFFPALSPDWIEVLSVFLGVAASVLGFSRFWAILRQRTYSRKLIQEAVENRHPAEKPDPNDVVAAGRYITRLTRHAEEDLKEIHPDFTLESLKRLERYLPQLMEEVEDGESAVIRLGIVGTYLGETLCRNRGYQWFFAPDPSLKQFVYLVSVLRKGDKTFDPFAAAADCLTGRVKMAQVLKDAA